MRNKKTSFGEAFRKMKEEQAAKAAKAGARHADDVKNVMMSEIDFWIVNEVCELPARMKETFEKAKKGGSSVMNLWFPGHLRSDVEITLEDLKTLEVFEALDAHCKEQDIHLSVTFTRASYGAHKSEPAIYITIDMNAPYAEVTAQKKSGNGYNDGKRRGSRRR